MKIAHIVPTSYLSKINIIKNANFNMVLAHQVLSDKEYAVFFKEKSRLGDFVLLDNSAFEFGDAVDDSTLISAIEEVQPTEFILPDVLFDSEKTYKRTTNFLRNFKNENLKLMAVPQGKTIEEWLESYKQLSVLPYVTSIGIGGVYAKREVFNVNISYVSGREYIFDQLISKNIIDRSKEHHLLGLGDSGHLELKNLKKNKYIRSADSSAAFIHGINGQSINGGKAYVKIREKINFNQEYSDKNIGLIIKNINVLYESAK